MATLVDNRSEQELNPIGDSGRHEPVPLGRPSRLSEAQLNAAAKVLDSYLHRTQEGTQALSGLRVAGSQ